MLDRLPLEASRGPRRGDAIRVAILGRPNVGKSSLFNKLLGEERTIVDSVPGTTRDTIDTTIERDGRTFVLVDTAGLRRKRKQRQGIDYYTELRALDAAERADVALVLIDSHDGIVEGDVTAVEVARKSHCATLIVLSKWDISEITIEDVRPELQRRFRQRPPFITISSTTGRGVSRLLDKVAELYDVYVSRVPTGELNRFLGELKEARQPPSKGGRRLNLLYGAQVAHAPAALPLHRQRPRPRHARLRLLGRESAARTVRARGGAGGDRFQEALVKAVVVGGGAWGSAFAKLLTERGHDVTVAAARDDRRGAVRAGRPRRDRGAEPLVS